MAINDEKVREEIRERLESEFYMKQIYSILEKENEELRKFKEE